MIEAMKQALDAAREWIGSAPHGDNCFLHDEGEYNRCFCGKDSIENYIDGVLDQAIAEAEKQEPVGYFSVNDYGNWEENENGYGEPFFTSPQTIEPLTDEEIVKVLLSVRENINGNVFLSFARAIESKLKEKNT
jgi:hypothetical protein